MFLKLDELIKRISGPFNIDKEYVAKFAEKDSHEAIKNLEEEILRSFPEDRSLPRITEKESLTDYPFSTEIKGSVVAQDVAYLKQVIMDRTSEENPESKNIDDLCEDAVNAAMKLLVARINRSLSRVDPGKKISPNDLLDFNSRYSYEFYHFINEFMIDISGDDLFPLKSGYYNGLWPEIPSIVGKLHTKYALHTAISLVNLWADTITVRRTDSSVMSATVRVDVKKDYINKQSIGEYRKRCQRNGDLRILGTLAAVPGITGSKLMKVLYTKRFCDGNPHSEYRLRWWPKPTAWFRLFRRRDLESIYHEESLLEQTSQVDRLYDQIIRFGPDILLKTIYDLMFRELPDDLQPVATLSGIIKYSSDPEEAWPPILSYAAKTEDSLRRFQKYQEILARYGLESKETISLSQSLEDTLFTFYHEFSRGNKIEIKTEIDNAATPDNYGKFSFLIYRNLLMNSIEAINERSRKEEKAPRKILIRTSEEEHAILVEIYDTGIGFDEKDSERFGVEQFSTKSLERGLGGISSAAFAREYHGHIKVSPSDLMPYRTKTTVSYEKRNAG